MEGGEEMRKRAEGKKKKRNRGSSEMRKKGGEKAGRGIMTVEGRARGQKR